MTRRTLRKEKKGDLRPLSFASISQIDPILPILFLERWSGSVFLLLSCGARLSLDTCYLLLRVRQHALVSKLVIPVLDFEAGVLVFRNELGQVLFGLRMSGVVGQIDPFVGIDAMVVEFFGTVLVADVTPAFGANSGVALAVRRDGRAARMRGVGELSFN